ncbi:MAG: STAS domain-containing protein [Spirochaetes bacterium]|nr:STAS domain-containing protein [Spirochaetota bacterium]
MEIRIYEKGGSSVIELKGDMDITSIKTIKTPIFNVVNNQDIKRLILDIEHVNYIDSSGIGILIVTYKKMMANNGEFYLCNVPEHVNRVLILTQMHKIFKYCTKKDFNL